MEGISLEDVAKKYNSINEVWSREDHWHQWTKKSIKEFINKEFTSLTLPESYYVLNAGSAGYSYGLDEQNIIHIDIAEKKVNQLPNHVVGDIQNLPFANEQFDLVICVGSVINYCDPIPVLSEFSRAQKNGGYLMLEFENSKTWELLGKKTFNLQSCDY